MVRTKFNLKITIYFSYLFPLSFSSENLKQQDQEQLSAFKRAVKSKQTRKHIIMQATFQGNSRSGKTSLCKVIQGKKADPFEPSTGVMDKPVHIELTQSTVVVNGLTWTPVDDLGVETVVLVQGVGVDTTERTAKPGTTSPTLSTTHSAAAPNRLVRSTLSCMCIDLLIIKKQSFIGLKVYS